LRGKTKFPMMILPNCPMSNYVHGGIDGTHLNKVMASIREVADDRTCGILAGAFLDNLLFDLLNHCLPESPVANRKELFKFDGPLGPFSNKVRMTHFMGLITVSDVITLDVIRDIRNLCAHSLGIREEQKVDFSHPSILNRLRKLYPEKALSLLQKEERHQIEQVRDQSLDALGGRLTFTLFFAQVALSIYARIQITDPFRLPDEINEGVDTDTARPDHG